MYVEQSDDVRVVAKGLQEHDFAKRPLGICLVAECIYVCSNIQKDDDIIFGQVTSPFNRQWERKQQRRTELLTEYLFDCHDTAVLLVDRLPNNAVSLVTCAKKKSNTKEDYTRVFSINQQQRPRQAMAMTKTAAVGLRPRLAGEGLDF